MKLRNKKTGEIVEPFGITCVNGRTFVQFDDGKGTFKFEAHSLAELNSEWEDYEEPKEYWYLSGNSEIRRTEDNGVKFDKYHKEVGNYFDTREEAEKAVHKLKAWKRLKDKGFRFKGISGYDEIHFWFPNPDDMFESSKTRKDLDLLFSGEDD